MVTPLKQTFKEVSLLLDMYRSYECYDWNLYYTKTTYTEIERFYKNMSTINAATKQFK
jgi:hypothetical protein